MAFESFSRIGLLQSLEPRDNICGSLVRFFEPARAPSTCIGLLVLQLLLLLLLLLLLPLSSLPLWFAMFVAHHSAGGAPLLGMCPSPPHAPPAMGRWYTLRLGLLIATFPFNGCGGWRAGDSTPRVGSGGPGKTMDPRV